MEENFWGMQGKGDLQEEINFALSKEIKILQTYWCQLAKKIFQQQGDYSEVLMRTLQLHLMKKKLCNAMRKKQIAHLCQSLLTEDFT